MLELCQCSNFTCSLSLDLGSKDGQCTKIQINWRRNGILIVCGWEINKHYMLKYLPLRVISFKEGANPHLEKSPPTYQPPAPGMGNPQPKKRD